MTEKLGPTGQFPEGMLRPDDKGELHLAIGHRQGRVIMNFGVSVEWVGMDPNGARKMAMLLLQHADRAQMEMAEAAEAAREGNAN